MLHNPQGAAVQIRGGFWAYGIYSTVRSTINVYDAESRVANAQRADAVVDNV